MKRELDPETGAGLDPADPATIAAVQREVDIANAQLSRVEQIKRFTLLADEWLPGGVELTPTLKLKRRPISDRYAATIDALYD
jgi:long-chain acyl-CoA synthetase